MEPHCQEDVLMSLHRSPAHTTQQEAWEADLKAFDLLNADNQQELRRIRWEAHEIISMFAAFQAVIFTAVSQRTVLTCALAWSPIALSAAACAAAFLALAHKFISIGDLQEEILHVGLCMSALQACLDQMGQQGSVLDLDATCPQAFHYSDSWAGYRYLRSKGSLPLFLLIAATVIVNVIFHATLCGHCPSCA